MKLTNTKQQPKWKFWLARLFGNKAISYDHSPHETTFVVSYEWRGNVYVTEVRTVDRVPYEERA